MMKLAVDNGPRQAVDGQRRALLAQVHIAQKDLAMDEDDYRALLGRVTGCASAKECDTGQLRAVIANFERLGFRSSGGQRRRQVGNKQTVRKARAMWISLYQLGAIDDGSDAALEAFGQRQLRVERLQWTNEREAFRLIEALKAMAARHGWDQKLPARMASADRVRLLKDRLIGAQLARLAAAGQPVDGALAADRAAWSDKRLERAAAELAAMIHALPKNA